MVSRQNCFWFALLVYIQCTCISKEPNPLYLFSPAFAAILSSIKMGSCFSGRNGIIPSYSFDYARYMCIRVDSVQMRDDTYWKEMLEQIVEVCCTVNYCNYRLYTTVQYLLSLF